MATELHTLRVEVRNNFPKLAQDTEKARKASDEFSKEYLQLKRATDSTFDSQVRMQKELDIIQKEFQQGSISADEYQAHLSRLSQMQSMAGGSARGTGVDMRNLSYQIQDVAVQASMGTDSLRILSMQGPQIASAFGPAGAAYGAVIAIGAAVGGALMPSLLNGKDAMEELSEAVEALDDIFDTTSYSVKGFNDEMQELLKTNEALAQLKIESAMLGIADSIHLAQEALEDINSPINRMIDYNESLATAVGQAAGGIRRQLNYALREAQEEYGLTEGEVISLTESITNLDDTNNQSIQSLLEQIAAIDHGTEAFSRYRDRLAEVLGLQLQLNGAQKVATDQLVPLNVNTRTLDESQLKVTDSFYKNRDAMYENFTYLDSLNAGLGEIDVTTRRMNLGMENQVALFKENSEWLSTYANKEMSFATKAKDVLMSTNAGKIISTSYSAAMKAYEALAGIPIVGPALGAAAAGTIIATGARFAARSISGRALGGQVRGGETYLVGERGPELLTMGGRGGFVTPNDQLRSQTINNNQGNTANVTFNITANDTAGFDELLNKRRGQIIGMVNQALNNSGRRNLV